MAQIGDPPFNRSFAQNTYHPDGYDPRTGARNYPSAGIDDPSPTMTAALDVQAQQAVDMIHDAHDILDRMTSPDGRTPQVGEKRLQTSTLTESMGVMLGSLETLCNRLDHLANRIGRL